MKKRVLNVVELVLQLAAIVLFYLIVGADRYGTIQPIHRALAKYMVYAIPLYTFWGLNVIMCLVSALSKNKKKDGKIHSTLAILIFILTVWIMFSLMETAINAFHWPCIAVTFFMVVVSFVKRANVFNETVEEVRVVNAASSDADELKKYKELLDAGAITQEEFDAKKKQLLGL